jgi:hypothetical protein
MSHARKTTEAADSRRNDRRCRSNAMIACKRTVDSDASIRRTSVRCWESLRLPSTKRTRSAFAARVLLMGLRASAPVHTSRNYKT